MSNKILKKLHLNRIVDIKSNFNEENSIIENKLFNLKQALIKKAKLIKENEKNNKININKRTKFNISHSNKSINNVENDIGKKVQSSIETSSYISYNKFNEIKYNNIDNNKNSSILNKIEIKTTIPASIPIKKGYNSNVVIKESNTAKNNIYNKEITTYNLIQKKNLTTTENNILNTNNSVKNKKPLLVNTNFEYNKDNQSFNPIVDVSINKNLINKWILFFNL